MENAAEALKMAAAVLIFLMALSVAIVSFGQVSVYRWKFLLQNNRN